MHASNNPTTRHPLEGYGPVRDGFLILERKAIENIAFDTGCHL